MRPRPLPDAESLRGLLRALLDRPASVGKRVAAPLPDTDLVTARYCDDHGVLVAACVTDIELAVAAAAALGLVGRAVAEEALRRGEIDGPLLEHYHEVANVISSLLNGPKLAHLRLVEVVNGVPEDVLELAARAPQRQFAVTVGAARDAMLTLVAA